MDKDNELYLYYKIIFEDSADSIFIANIEGAYIDVNNKACELLGYTKEELLSLSIPDITYPEYINRLEKVYENILSGEKLILEWKLKHKQGHYVDVEISTSLLPNNSLIGIVRDISERKRLELELKRQEEFYKTLANNSYDIITILDAEGNTKYISDNIAKFFGYDKDELLNNNKVFTLIHPDDLPIIMSEFEKLKNIPQGKKTIQYRAKNKDGIYHWLEITAVNLLENNIVKGVLSNAMFIDDRKTKELEIETLHQETIATNEFLQLKDEQIGHVLREITELNQKLLKSEVQLKRQLELNASLSEFSKHVINYDSTIDEISIDINRYIKSITQSEHGFVGIIDPVTKDFHSYSLTEMLSGKCNIQDYEHRRVVFPIGQDGLYKGLWGHALNQREAYYSNSPSKHKASTGIPKGHIPLNNFAAYPVIFDKDLLGLISIANPKEDYTDETLIILKSFAELYAMIIYRKRLEVNLRESEERSRSLAELAFEGIVIHSRDRIVEANKSAFEILGYENKEELMKATTVMQFIAPTSQKNVMSKINSNYEGCYEIELIRKDGTIFPAELNSIVTIYRGEKARVVSFRDIIERKKYELEIENSLKELEKFNADLLSLNIKLQNEIIARKKVEKELEIQKELLQQWNKNLEEEIATEVEKSRIKDELMLLQSRQAAMGEMIGNIAHQWRQPLNALSLMAFDLKEAEINKELDAEYLKKSVANIVKTVQHMSSTIDDFRHFFKPDKEAQQFNINQIIKKSISFVEISFKDKNIDILFKDDIPLNPMGYPNEYAQVLLNILNNSKDAIIERGVEKGQVVIELEAIDNRSICRISDNGGGISESILHKIFDPYFTTKDDKHGSGIGLYMSKIIIEKNMGGKLNVRNIEGGVEFEIIINN